MLNQGSQSFLCGSLVAAKLNPFCLWRRSFRLSPDDALAGRFNTWNVGILFVGLLHLGTRPCNQNFTCREADHPIQTSTCIQSTHRISYKRNCRNHPLFELAEFSRCTWGRWMESALDPGSVLSGSVPFGAAEWVSGNSPRADLALAEVQTDSVSPRNHRLSRRCATSLHPTRYPLKTLWETDSRSVELHSLALAYLVALVSSGSTAFLSYRSLFLQLFQCLTSLVLPLDSAIGVSAHHDLSLIHI